MRNEDMLTALHEGCREWLDGVPDIPTTSANVRKCAEFMVTHAQACLEAFYEVVEEKLKGVKSNEG